MKKTAFLLLFICISSYAQKNINSYKYIIVPEKFDFLKKPDKYQTSSLTKFLFEKNGFKTFLNNEDLPQDLSKNRCLALEAVVKSNSTMLVTKNTIELRNCKNELVFKSLEGKSKEKDFKKSYHQAIRNAFKSIASLKYTYQPATPKSKKIRSVKQGEKSPNYNVTPLANNTGRKVVDQKRKKSNNVEGNVKDKGRNNNPFSNGNKIPVLYAKSTSEGFQLLNEKNQIIFNLLETKKANVFAIKDRNGIIYKENNIWIADFHDEKGEKVVKKYDVRLQK